MFSAEDPDTVTADTEDTTRFYSKAEEFVDKNQRLLNASTQLRRRFEEITNEALKLVVEAEPADNS